MSHYADAVSKSTIEDPQREISKSQDTTNGSQPIVRRCESQRLQLAESPSTRLGTGSTDKLEKQAVVLTCKMSSKYRPGWTQAWWRPGTYVARSSPMRPGTYASRTRHRAKSNRKKTRRDSRDSPSPTLSPTLRKLTCLPFSLAPTTCRHTSNMPAEHTFTKEAPAPLDGIVRPFSSCA